MAHRTKSVVCKSNPKLDRWGFPLPPAALAKIAASQPLPRYAGMRSKFLLGLRRLCGERTEGQTFSNRQIARECGVSSEIVRRTVRSGLRKLRNRLPPEVRSEFEAMLAAERTVGKPVERKPKLSTP